MGTAGRLGGESANLIPGTHISGATYVRALLVCLVVVQVVLFLAVALTMRSRRRGCLPGVQVTKKQKQKKTVHIKLDEERKKRKEKPQHKTVAT